jgi:hypothetical protein
MLKYIILVLFLAGSFCFAQTGVKLKGKVSDIETGEIISTVAVSVYRDSTRKYFIAGVNVGSNGNFSFNLIPGSYWLTTSGIGYLPASVLFTIEPDKPIELNVRIKKKVIMMQQVLIEAKRDTFKNTSTVDLDIDFLKTIPTISGEVDLFRALTLLPGVTTSSEISGGLYVRGGSPDQNLTLVDGVVIYNPFHLGGFATTLNNDAISNIRLVKGAYPAEYGGRLSSILDITLRDGSKENFKGVIGLGTISSRFSLEGPVSPVSSFMISGRKLYLDILEKQFLKSSAIPLYGFYDLNAKVDYIVSDLDKITLSGYYSNDNLYNSPSDKNTAFNIKWQNTALSLGWVHLSGENKFTKVSLNYTGYSFSTLLQDKHPDAFKNDFYAYSAIDDFGLKIDGQYISSESHTVKNGLELTLHKLNLLNNNYFTQTLTNDERIQNKYIAVETAAYIQDHWQVTPLLYFNLGTRFYYFPVGRYFNIEPRVSGSLNLTDDIYIKGAFAISNQYLHLLVRNDVVLPTDIWFPSTSKINPGKAMQGVFGFEANLDNKTFVLSTEGYYKRMNNLYEYSNNAVFSTEVPMEDQLTKGNGDAYGLEFFFNKKKGDLSGWLGYTLSWTRRYFTDINNGEPFYPRYDKRHEISLVLSYKFDESWSAGATWNYSTGQAYTMPVGQYYFPGVYSANPGNQIFLDYQNINNYRLPSFHKLDMSATYKFSWNTYAVELTLSIYNVYNRQNPFARYVTFSDAENGNIKPQLNQFTLFPFFPTISAVVNL